MLPRLGQTVTENWVIEALSVGTLMAYLETIMAYSNVHISLDKTFFKILKKFIHSAEVNSNSFESLWFETNYKLPYQGNTLIFRSIKSFG